MDSSSKPHRAYDSLAHGLSVVFGVIMGAIPGLSGTLGIALLLPFTFGLPAHVGLLMLFVFGLGLIKVFVRVLRIPPRLLVASIMSLAIVGSYSIKSSVMDVLTMGFMGVLGFILIRFKFGVAPVALGLILGKTLEEGFKLSLRLGAAKGDVLMYYFSRPQSLVLIALTVLSLLYSAYKEYKTRQKEAQKQAASTEAA